MSAFTVSIGDFEMNMRADPINSDGSVPKGRPNPTRITWTKSNEIKIHSIPWPEYKTIRTSKRTLWKLDIDFIILTNSDCQEIADMVDNVGPYMVKTAFKSMLMYIESFTTNAEEALDDYHQSCQMKLVEMND